MTSRRHAALDLSAKLLDEEWHVQSHHIAAKDSERRPHARLPATRPFPLPLVTGPRSRLRTTERVAASQLDIAVATNDRSRDSRNGPFNHRTSCLITRHLFDVPRTVTLRKNVTPLPVGRDLGCGLALPAR